jgi:hypothetical protein
MLAGAAFDLIWWLAGILLAIGYFTFVCLAFHGKVPGDSFVDRR